MPRLLSRLLPRRLPHRLPRRLGVRRGLATRQVATLQIAALGGVALLLGGAAVAYVAYTDEGDPTQVVRDYFAALSAGDAPRALSYGDVPGGSHELLTSAALAEQQRIAPLTGFEARASTIHADRASVQVRYRLGFAGRPQDIGTTVGLRHVDGHWRLDRVAATGQLAIQQAAARASLLGGAVPAASVSLFPGALPIGFDTPYLQLDAVHDHVELADAAPRLDVQVKVSARGSRAARAAVGAALRACLDGRGPVTCPLPGERYVPGSLRGSLRLDFARGLTVSVLDSAAGVLEVTGSVRLRASYRRLDFDNVESAGHGSVELPIRSAGYAVAPLRMSWEQT
ncbi:hypothetical protein [uncultured Jatrophihabitans sp.]|uniref:hypothetical protein n=1 Tax=uncultured Jatrophihabitans sp. TaxID=1610747 RepID=UPI0035CA5448